MKFIYLNCEIKIFKTEERSSQYGGRVYSHIGLGREEMSHPNPIPSRSYRLSSIHAL